MSVDKLVLMTAGNSPFARAVMAALSTGHRFRAVDLDFTPGLPSQVEVCQGDLRDPAMVASAVQGVDRILHLAPISTPATSPRQRSAGGGRVPGHPGQHPRSV
ncbi:MAG: hypothetical protein M1546_14715 [Chloroflexi bacterium]|nr:hypothetical protein [Chloroflexota bacterium]